MEGGSVQHDRGARATLLVLTLATSCSVAPVVDVSVEPTPSASGTTECEAATQESVYAIAAGLIVHPTRGTLRNAFAVPLQTESPSGFTYVVAAEIDGVGIEGNGEIGTWAVGELGGEPIVAANSLAQRWSDWGVAGTEGSPADLERLAVAGSDAAAAAHECVAIANG